MPRPPHLPLLLSIGVAAAGAVWVLSETRRVAAHNRHLELKLADATGRSTQLSHALDEAVAERAALGRDLAQAVEVGDRLLREAQSLGVCSAQLAERNHTLQAEMEQSVRQRDEFNRTLEERVEEIRQAERDQERRERERFGPMPEGVRLALVALNRCLAEDGYPEVRFLWAREIDGRVLRDVELIEHDRKTLETSLCVAGRATLHFDRERGQLTVRLFDGHRLGAGEQVSFPEEGEAVAFTDLRGPVWESRVGHLMEVEGQYPLPEQPERLPRLRRDVRDAWIARFGQLLEGAGTEVTYRVDEIGALQGAVFRDVLLLGYRGGKTLQTAIEAARLSVVVDPATSTVELVLEDGVVRKSGGETKIGGRGYRILLPDVTRARAIDTMMGMVVDR